MLMPTRTTFLLVGWTLCGFLAYKAITNKTETKVYNPFEILDISTVCNLIVIIVIFTHCRDIERHHKRHQVALQEALPEIVCFYRSLIDVPELRMSLATPTK